MTPGINAAAQHVRQPLRHRNQPHRQHSVRGRHTAAVSLGNYVHADAGCGTQGITSYDGGTNGVTIEDNVVDIRRPFGIELFADRNSVVRHNTVRWYADADCHFTGLICGQIDINRKSQDPAGSGTQVYDNLTTGVGFNNGSTGTAHHNVSGRRARYVGPLHTYAGFKLARKSPVGRRRASDGLDVGARIHAPRSRGGTAGSSRFETPLGRTIIDHLRQPALLATALFALGRVIRGIS